MKLVYKIIITIINNLETRKMQRVEVIRMNNNCLEKIIVFMKK